jgi:hypothetical protein
MATTGNAAAATTIPASRPQISNDAAFVKTPWSRLRIQVTGTGYVTRQHVASWPAGVRFHDRTTLGVGVMSGALIVARLVKICAISG